MSLTEIEALLDKYYDAQTSPEEEGLLREYFSNENVPDHLRSHQEQFIYYHNANKEHPPDVDWEVKLSQKILSHENTRKESKRRKIYYVVTGIAASILILVGVYFQFVVDHKKSKYSVENTYDDPEKAYTEAKKALLLVSEKFNAGVQDFNKFSTFSQYQELITRKK